MQTAVTEVWKSKQTDETRMVESKLKDAGFERADAYRYNTASIRVRVVDPRFEGLKITRRDQLVEKVLDELPDETQRDIITLITLSPSEMTNTSVYHRQSLSNQEFEHPSCLDD